jgi:ubiquinone/menaquinone biosynthesis C-methylase UbiE
VEYSRAHNADPRLTFEIGDAQALPYDDEAFDVTLALLVVNLIPDAKKAAREMRRVTRIGGAMATAMWDQRRA